MLISIVKPLYWWTYNFIFKKTVEFKTPKDNNKWIKINTFFQQTIYLIIKLSWFVISFVILWYNRCPLVFHPVFYNNIRTNTGRHLISFHNSDPAVASKLYSFKSLSNETIIIKIIIIIPGQFMKRRKWGLVHTTSRALWHFNDDRQRVQ